MSFDARLTELGIELPDAPTPMAAYVPAVQTGNLLWIAGQPPGAAWSDEDAQGLQHVVARQLEAALDGARSDADGRDQLPVLGGHVGADYSVEEGAQAARAAGLNILAQVRKATGSLDAVARVVKVVGFVNAAPGMDQAHLVVNGCSELMLEVFGDAGRHARSAVGTGTLPLNIPVEIEAVFELRA